MYYDHQFYRFLQRSYRVQFQPDALVIVNRDGEDEKRVPYSEMNQRELAALAHYIGMLAEKIRDAI